jgi:hypothetical protein
MLRRSQECSVSQVLSTLFLLPAAKSGEAVWSFAEVCSSQNIGIDPSNRLAILPPHLGVGIARRTAFSRTAFREADAEVRSIHFPKSLDVAARCVPVESRLFNNVLTPNRRRHFSRHGVATPYGSCSAWICKGRISHASVLRAIRRLRRVLHRPRRL